MIVSVGSIRGWSASGLEDTGNTLRSRAQSLVALQDDLDGAGVQPSSWTGEGATAAAVKRGKIAEELRRLIAGVEAVRIAVWAAADSVVAVKQALREAQELAQIYYFRIGDDSMIYERDPGEMEEHFAADREAMRVELDDRLVQIIRMAYELNVELARVMMLATNDQIDDGTAAALVAAQTAGIAAGSATEVPPPPIRASPAANNAYYDSLTEGQRAQLMRTHPELLGNLDGIPGSVRDEANRVRLPSETERARVERDAAQAAMDRLQEATGSSPASAEDIELAKGLGPANDRLAALDAVRRTLGDGIQLLVLDASGERVKAAVATGDVDTADHVTVHVPGMGTTVQGALEDKVDEMNSVGKLTEQQLRKQGHGGETVASVTWIGYEPPMNLAVASSDDIAKAAAPDLNNFLNGIGASRTNDPNLTMLAHSYGSTLTGYALQEDSGVDNAVFFGSPGLGTNDIDDLLVPEGRVFVAEAKDDLVADAGLFGGDPNRLDGVSHLSTSEGISPDGVLRAGSTGHSGYTTDESMSQWNLAMATGGLYDRMVFGGNAGYGDVLGKDIRENFLPLTEW